LHRIALHRIASQNIEEKAEHCCLYQTVDFCAAGSRSRQIWIGRTDRWTRLCWKNNKLLLRLWSRQHQRSTTSCFQTNFVLWINSITSFIYCFKTLQGNCQ
jgi:hypothetical protein